MENNTDKFLSRLSGVSEKLPGRWTARCPAHEDRSPSLSVAEIDGKVLVRCFAGCSFSDIVAAVGMEPQEMFPPRAEHGRPIPASQRWIPRQVLESTAREALIVVLAADQISRGEPLNPADHARLTQAATALREAARSAGANV